MSYNSYNSLEQKPVSLSAREKDCLDFFNTKSHKLCIVI